jgi:hypothetical protein
LSKISEKTAATTESGADPKNPAKNLHNITVCKSFDAATAKLNTIKPKLEITIGSLRPCNSDKGAHRIGPNAKPNIVSILHVMWFATYPRHIN